MFAFGDEEWPGVAKLNEESGELVRIIGKLMATHGKTEYWDGVDLRKELVFEMADAAAAIDLVMKYALTEAEKFALVARLKEKFALYEKWHAEQSQPPLDLAKIEADRKRDETVTVRDNGQRR